MKKLKRSMLLFLGTTLMMMSFSTLISNVHATPSTEHPKHHFHKRRPADGGFLIKDTAAILGIQPQVLISQLKQGKSLLQVAQSSKGLNEEEYLQKLTTLAHEHLNQAVATKKMTIAHAEELKAKLPSVLKKAIHHQWKKPDHTPQFMNNTV
ncbi:hypothetical protein D3C77_434720 [compost metagenome]